MYDLLLHVIRSFISVDAEEALLMQTLFVQKENKKGDFFVAEGNVCREIGFLTKGLVRYFIRNEEGEELIYDFGEESNFVCNYESFLDGSPSQKNIQFIEDAQWLSLSHHALQSLYKNVRNGQQFGRLVCERIFVDALRKITSLYTYTPVQRYQQFVSLYPSLQQRIPQYYISSFVGVKPQSLSRIRKRLAHA